MYGALHVFMIWKSKLFNLFLFVVTFITTTLAGAEWIFARSVFFSDHPLAWSEIFYGLYFSVPFLAILTVHEFGHYFTAKWYRIQVTLPYYIPFWFFSLVPSIGTMGAFIRIKGAVTTRKEYFDIGVAGPLAGFIVAMGVLYYGFTHLPAPEYIFTIHPEYKVFGLDYAKYVYENVENSFALGKNLIFIFFEKVVVKDPSLVPNSYEMMHYPWLFAGYLALFFTALNLMPIGQLDGGHILYGLLGEKNHRIISSVLFVLFVSYAGLGVITPFQAMESLWWNGLLYIGFLYLLFSRVFHGIRNALLAAVVIFTSQFLLSYAFPGVQGYHGWLVFAFFLGRVVGIYHPPVLYDYPLDRKRKLIGWISLIIFILCFTPMPFIVG